QCFPGCEAKIVQGKVTLNRLRIIRSGRRGRRREGECGEKECRLHRNRLGPLCNLDQCSVPSYTRTQSRTPFTGHTERQRVTSPSSLGLLLEQADRPFSSFPVI